ncbi:hypothetical protein DY000_02039494 [Brassica cretica]|uniref:FBD domain-containing protein n=1 Tax=Brassica cretica TaxID=69181 RepID=A0ABQ7BIP8_BRACR|nr:hypothetical protein DY000_02039494 [Brassica cretica]
MWAVVEIAPVACVEPFGIPSRSIGQLRGNRTFVGRVVLQFLVLLAGVKSFDFIMLDVSSRNPSILEISSLGLEVLEFILLKHGGLWASSPRNPEFVELVFLEPKDFRVDPSEIWRFPDVGELLYLPCQ